MQAQIRDATVVRRAVTLGLPVIMVEKDFETADSVGNDYLRVSNEIIRHEDLT